METLAFDIPALPPGQPPHILPEPPTVIQIDALRRKRGVQLKELLGAAGIKQEVWYRAKAGKFDLSASLRIRLLTSLDCLAAASPEKNISQIDVSRKALGIPTYRLLAAAGVAPRVWYDGKSGGCATRKNTLRRLTDALEKIAHRSAIIKAPVAIGGLVHLLEAIIEMSRSEDPSCDRLIQKRKHIFAVYLVAVELEIENAEIARALGCKRQNVHQLRLDVEELRDNPSIDAMLDRCAALMKGQRT